MYKTRWELAYIRVLYIIILYRRVNGDHETKFHDTSESLSKTTPVSLARKHRGDRIRTCDFLVPNQAL